MTCGIPDPGHVQTVRPHDHIAFASKDRSDARMGPRRVREVMGVDDEVDEQGEVEKPRAEQDLNIDEEDVAARRVLPTPVLPSQSEIDEHMIDHLPFRAWCRCCLEGAGREMAHWRVGDHGFVPIIAFDYLFLGRNGVVTRSELTREDEESPELIKVLAVRDTKSKAITAHVVPQKGVDVARYSVACITECVTWLGCSRVILHSDNEKPIVKLLTESLKSLRVQSLEPMEQHGVPYDSQGNGIAEIGVQLVKARLATMKRSLEIRLRHRIPSNAAIVAWLIPHAMFVYSIRKKHEGDGLTSYCRVKGRDFSTRLFELGERCHFRGNDVEAAQGYRVRVGTFVGFDKLNGRYLVHDEGKLHNVRTVTRLPNSMKCDVAAVQELKLVPWQTHQPHDDGVVSREGPELAQASCRQRSIDTGAPCAYLSS